jgi:hypothetical protein
MESSSSNVWPVALTNCSDDEEQLNTWYAWVKADEELMGDLLDKFVEPNCQRSGTRAPLIERMRAVQVG